jgi:hypothetical protein
MGRELVPNERALLEWLLLESKLEDADTLRAQIPFTRVVKGETDLPTLVHLSVLGAPPALCEDGHVPGGAVVESASGEPTGFLDLWVEDGYLTMIEHSWVTDEMPRELPSVEQLRAWRPEEIH